LIENGADINILSSKSKTPLDYAIESGRLDIIKALNTKGAETQHSCIYCNPLILENVVTSGDVNDVIFLKNHGADLFLKNSLEMSLLHTAAWNNNKGVVRYLIAEGLNVNEMDEKGKTPLHYAAMAGNLEIVKILIENGADINAQVTDGEAKGMTPYDYAVNAKHKEVAEYLKSIRGTNREKVIIK
jgi:ankyrin repeat protein